MTSLDNLSAAEKQQEIAAFHARQHKVQQRGKVIVIIVAVLVIVGALSNFSAGFDYFVAAEMVFNTGCAVALLKGYSWARYVLIAGFVLSFFAVFFQMTLIDGSRYHAPTQTISWEINHEIGMPVPTIYTTERTLREDATDAFLHTIVMGMHIALMALYLVVAVVLFKSKSVKEYMYAIRHN